MTTSRKEVDITMAAVMTVSSVLVATKKAKHHLKMRATFNCCVNYIPATNVIWRIKVAFERPLKLLTRDYFFEERNRTMDWRAQSSLSVR